MTKDLIETIFKDLDSIVKYIIKELLDNMNKNKMLKQILIKEKFKVKTDEKQNDLEFNLKRIGRYWRRKSLQMIVRILYF